MSNSELAALEQRVTAIELQLAVREERDKQTAADIAEIKAYIKESRTDNKWTFRLLVTTVLGLFGTVLTFFIKGGLSGGG